MTLQYSRLRTRTDKKREREQNSYKLVYGNARFPPSRHCLSITKQFLSQEQFNLMHWSFA